MSNADPTINTLRNETAADISRSGEIRGAIRSYEISWSKSNFNQMIDKNLTT